MRSIWLVAQREFKTRTLAKANIITTIITLVVIAAAALIGKPLLDRSESAADQIAVTGEASSLTPYLEQSAAGQFADLEFLAVPEAADPASLLEDGFLAVVQGDPGAIEIVVDGMDNTIVSVVSSAATDYALAEAISELGGDPQAVAQAVAAATPVVTDLEEPRDFDLPRYISGLVVIVILFMVLIQGASIIMMSVVEEKVSRVVEILLATLRPAQLLGGKLLGVGLYSLFQALVMFVPLLGAAWYMGFLDEFAIDLGTLTMNLLVWFLLGYALYAILFGGLASLISRQEDIGAVSTPMIFLVLTPFYLAMFLIPNSPDGLAATILTQVPFFSPFLVPIRAAFGAIQTWEVALAIVICVIAIPVFTWVGGRVYSRAVLHTGGRMKLREALKSS